MEKQAVITATDLCIGYRTHKGEKKVHEHLSFGLYPGELTSLLGANGAGKSTLLRTLSASQPSLAGDLQLLGKPLQQYSEKERSRTIGVVLTDKTQAAYRLLRTAPSQRPSHYQRGIGCRRHCPQSRKLHRRTFGRRTAKGNDSQSIGSGMSAYHLG